MHACIEKKKKYAAAEQLYKEAIKIRENIFGPNDVRLDASLRNYAQLLRDMNRDKDAEDIESRAKKIEAKIAPD